MLLSLLARFRLPYPKQLFGLKNFFKNFLFGLKSLKKFIDRSKSEGFKNTNALK